MIKNIVFDLGNVLISFKPSEYLENKKIPENNRKIILSDIFESSEWKMLDEGAITVPDAIDAISLKSSLTRAEIALVFNSRTEIIFPLIQNIKLLPALKKEGFRLFFLSNFPDDIFDEVQMAYSFFRYFDGGIISSRVNLSKPDNRIYRLLLEKYILKPYESVFIDDSEVNVLAADLIGMKALHYKENMCLETLLWAYLK